MTATLTDPFLTDEDSDDPTEVIPTVAEQDESAPWGRKADGTPRAKPGAKPSGTPKRAASPRKRTPGSSRTRQSGGTDYRPGLIALGQLPVFIGSIAARFAKKPETQTAIQLNALTIKVHMPNMAEALNETAKTQTGLANALDKVLSAGPYGMIFAAGVPIVLQILANHGAIEPNPQMGVMSAEELVAAASS